MTARPALRRSALAGLGALGAAMVAAPAPALAQVVPLPSPVAGVVDPLVSPLAPVVPGAVDAVISPAPTPVKDAAGAITAPLKPAAPPNNTPPTTASGSGPQPTAADPGTQLPAAPAPPANAPVSATSATGVTALPMLSPRAADALLAGRFGPAANPLTLFGAPQIAPALSPLLAATDPKPTVALPANSSQLISDPVPVPTGGVPGLLVAVAAGLVAAAAGAQISELRERRIATA